jgi:solute carrier family 35 (adenosine 3'-phospho 5'-phosphosulfate transporter), member B2
MRVPYGADKELFKHSLFLVFCNRITTSMVSAIVLLVHIFSKITTGAFFESAGSPKLYIIVQRSKKSLDPVAPLHNYGVVSMSNILTTTCQYEVMLLPFIYF